MSKGDRGAFFAIGLVAGVGLALLFFVWAFPWFSDPQQGAAYCQSGDQDCAEHYQNSDDPHFWVRPFYGWIYAEDTLAQWLMAGFSVIATGVSLFAVILLGRTLAEARKTTHAALRAGRAAVQANKDASTRFAAEQRPWLSILEKPDVSLGRINGELYVAATAKVKNVGIGPAIGIQGHVMVKYGLLPSAPSYTIAEFAKRARTSAEFGNRVIFPSSPEESVTGFDNDIADNREGYPFTFVYVCLTYTGQNPNEVFHTGMTVQTYGSLDIAATNDLELLRVDISPVGISMSIR